MELTDECIERIKDAARKISHGKLVVTILPRPDDKQNYDVLFGWEERVQFEKFPAEYSTPV